jgi:hypothetical protein
VKTEAKGKSYVAPNPELGAAIYYYLKTPAKDVSAVITDAKDGKVTGDIRTNAGLHRIVWKQAAPGDYTVEFRANGQTFTQKLRVDKAE